MLSSLAGRSRVNLAPYGSFRQVRGIADFDAFPVGSER